MSDIVIRSESLGVAWDEATALMKRHWEEVETVPLSMNKTQYVLLEEMGHLHLYTIRDLKVLVGYAVFSSAPTLHHARVKLAVCDALYIEPAYRSLAMVGDLLRCAEYSLTSRGAQYIRVSTTTTRDFGPVLKRKGYNHVESVYAKKLGE